MRYICDTLVFNYDALVCLIIVDYNIASAIMKLSMQRRQCVAMYRFDCLPCLRDKQPAERWCCTSCLFS